TAAANSAAAALQSVAASGGLGGGGGGALGNLFGIGSAGGGDPEGLMGVFAGGLPAFAMGTPYVPRDMIAQVHRGEAIIPASMNRPGTMGASIATENHFHFAGPVD